MKPILLFLLLCLGSFAADREACRREAGDVWRGDKLFEQRVFEEAHVLVTNAPVVVTLAAPSNVIARAAQAATIAARTNVDEIIRQSGTNPAAIQEWLETHAAAVDAETREDFRTLNDIWGDIAEWCPDGLISGFVALRTVTNAPVVEWRAK